MRIAIITGSRADWNGLGMVGKALKAAGFAVEVIATGQHAFNGGIDSTQAIYDDGFSPTIVSLESCWPDIDHVIGMAGRGVTRLGQALGRLKPDLALVAGDRYEALSAAFSASIVGIPIAHIAGGDITEGSQDDNYRRAITALACIHLATTWDAHGRLRGMVRPGDWIDMTGSPAIDRIWETPMLDRADTFNAIGLFQRKHNVLVAFHPATLSDDPQRECQELLHALVDLEANDNVAYLLLGSNADEGARAINLQLRSFAERSFADRSGMTTFRTNLQPQLYYSALTHFDLLIGNSSAGYYEAPSFGIPVVDIGDRQFGRTQPKNVIGAAPYREAILSAAELQLKLGRIKCENPYGDGQSSARIVEAIQANTWRCSRTETAA